MDGVARDDAPDGRAFAAGSEWPISEVPPMPLRRGMVMVRLASRELLSRGMELHEIQTLDRQHALAVQEAHNKWQLQQSRLRNEAANRFFVIAKGWAMLLAAAGGGSVITLLVEHVLLT